MSVDSVEEDEENGKFRYAYRQMQITNGVQTEGIGGIDYMGTKISTPYAFKFLAQAQEKVQEDLRIKQEEVYLSWSAKISEYTYLHKVFELIKEQSLPGVVNLKFGRKSYTAYTNRLRYFKDNKVSFAIVNLADKFNSNNSYCIIICKKCDFHYIARLVLKHNKMRLALSTVLEKPILEPNLLAEIEHTIFPLFENKADFSNYGVSPKRGIMFLGEPGNGKTMTVRYLMAACQKLYNAQTNILGAGSIQDAFSKDDLDRLFNTGELIVFDDVDINLFDRSKEGKIAGALLGAMDGIRRNNKINVRIFTTNEEVVNFDEAFKRSGRIDKVFKFNKPTSNLRRQFIQTWHSDITSKVDQNYLIENTHDLSFADLNDIKTQIVDSIIYKKKPNLDEIFLGLENKYETTHDSKKVGFVT